MAAKHDDYVEGQWYIGRVTDFDFHGGLGEIKVFRKENFFRNLKRVIRFQDFEESPRIPFHCVSIADKSRNITKDKLVSFQAHWHPRGRWEAINIGRPENAVDLNITAGLP